MLHSFYLRRKVGWAVITNPRLDSRNSFFDKQGCKIMERVFSFLGGLVRLASVTGRWKRCSAVRDIFDLVATDTVVILRSASGEVWRHPSRMVLALNKKITQQFSANSIAAVERRESCMRFTPVHNVLSVHP